MTVEPMRRGDGSSNEKQAASVAERSTSSIDDLPAVYRFGANQQLVTPATQKLEFLDDEFSTSKFDSLGKWVWMAGRPYPPRPLNIQRVLRREIIATTDISLHLVWTSGKIFIKPLPRFLLSKEFYDQHLKFRGIDHVEPALGFLYTYLALLSTELDFSLAEKNHLLPPTFDWTKWKELSSKILNDEHYKDRKIYRHIPRRYHYGELRLSRLDKIARYVKLDLHHGYSRLTESTQYTGFIVKYLSPIAAAIAYVVVLLSALQTGLATEYLGKVREFQNASVGFALFALIAPLVAFSIAMLILLGLFFVNLFKSIRADKKSHKDKGGLEPLMNINGRNRSRNVEAQ